MTYQRLLKTLRWSSIALLLTGLATPVGAQIFDDPTELDTELGRMKRARFEAFARAGASSDVIDRAAAMVGLNNLSIETYNYGPLTGWNFGSSFTYPNKDGRSRNYIYFHDILFGVEEGPWHAANPIVHDTYDHDSSRIDWEAQDGSRGNLYADPPQLLSGFPMFAVSDLAATWPSGGWPAPSETEVWWGTTSWDKWELAGDRNTYAVFDDTKADREDPAIAVPLGIEVTMRTISFVPFDIVYFQYEFTNTSSNTYTNVYIGSGVDTGGPTTHDNNDGYLVYEENRQLLYVRGWTYDAPSGTMTAPDNEAWSFVGVMCLESPTGSLKKSGGVYVDNPADVLTRVALIPYSDRIDAVSEGDAAVYGAMSGDTSYMQVNDAVNVWGSVAAPILKQDSADFLGRFSDQEDPWYYASAGPFDFAPGESVNYVLAAVGGINEDAFYATADLAIATYNARFQAPGPPQRPDDFRANGVAAGPHGKTYDPVLHEYPIYYTPSGNITLTWDLTAAMSTPDPNSGEVDFGGIRLWRSVDRGLTWGQQWLDNQGTPLGWYPYRQWDLIDGFVGTDAMTGEYIGSDTGLVSSFTETDMVDGMEYWYAITAYDRGAWVGGLGGTEVFQPLSTARGDDPNYPTMVAVIAGSRPGDFVDGMIGTGTAASSSYYVLNSTGEAGNASIYVEVVDGTAITGDSYQLAVTDYFIDAFGDTTHSNVLTPATGDEFIAAGVTLTNTVTGSLLYQYREASREAYGWENIPVTEGFRVYAQDVNDGQPGVYDWDAVGSHGWSMYRDLTPYRSGSLERVIHNDAYWDLDVIWRFFDAAGDTNKAVNRHTRRVVQAPFEIWDVENNIRRWPVITDNYGASDNWDHGWEAIYVTTVPYANNFFDLGTYPDHDPLNDPYWAYPPDEDNPAVSQSEWVYYFELDESDPDTWEDGETWHADMYRPLSLEIGASLSFSTTTSTIDETLISMDEIRAVPNPYYVFAEWDQSDIRRKIQFTNVPTNSTIDIYTISGELIASLRHDPVVYNSDHVGTVDWNLWTFEFTEAAYGLYIYVVKTDDGRKKIGKLTIIR